MKKQTLKDQVLKGLVLTMDKKNPKQELNYAYIDYAKNRLVATDTKAMISFEWETTEEFTDFLNQFQEISSSQEGIKVINSKGLIETIQGRYPDYERILCNDLSNKLVLDEGFLSSNFFKYGIVLNFFDKKMNSILQYIDSYKPSIYIDEKNTYLPVFTSCFIDNISVKTAIMPIVKKHR